jgi:hypothetical protein
VCNTEENDAFQIDHVRTQETSQTPNDAQQRRADSLAGNDTQRNSNASRTTETKNVNKALSNGKPDHDKTDDANQIRTEDLKKRKSRHLLIREIQLTHSKNVHH